MIQNPNTQPTLAIYRDGEIATEYLPAVPTALETVTSLVTTSIAKVTGKLVLEGRMIAYDTIHGTNYREIKHEVTRRDNEAKFIASIGLVAIK